MITFSGKTGTAVGTFTCLDRNGYTLAGLGQSIPPAATTTPIAYDATLTRLQAEEAIKTQKTHRMWMIVSALVGVGGLIVAVISLRKKS